MLSEGQGRLCDTRPSPQAWVSLLCPGPPVTTVPLPPLPAVPTLPVSSDLVSHRFLLKPSSSLSWSKKPGPGAQLSLRPVGEGAAGNVPDS